MKLSFFKQQQWQDCSLLQSENLIPLNILDFKTWFISEKSSITAVTQKHWLPELNMAKFFKNLSHFMKYFILEF